MSETLEHLIEMIDDARYALVAGNLANESVVPTAIDSWLKKIQDAAYELQAEEAGDE